MHERLSIPFRLAAGAAALAFCASAGAAQIKVTIENLVPTNSNGISFAPLHVGFGSGSFDSFNIGQAAGAEIISVAELGGGSEWQAAFAAAEPNATRGTIGGALLPGASSSATFMIDATSNPFFTFAAMVLPSNDHFIGNDSPMQYRLFNAAGQLAITSIVQYAGDIWDAGSEVSIPRRRPSLSAASRPTVPRRTVSSVSISPGWSRLSTGKLPLPATCSTAPSARAATSIASASRRCPSPKAWH
jgi:hypothetical protein